MVEKGGRGSLFRDWGRGCGCKYTRASSGVYIL